MRPLIASEIAVHAGEVEIEFVDRRFFKHRGLVIDDLGDEHRMAAIGIHVAAEDDGLGTKAEGHLHGHGGMDTIAASFIAAGGHHPAPSHAADDQGLALQAAVAEAFDRDEKGVQVEVEYCLIIHGPKIRHIVTIFAS